MKVGISSDHAGFDLKEHIKRSLEENNFQINDYGCFSDESADYPDFAHELAKAYKKGDIELGIIMCGSGNGVNMTINKHQEIRSALCWNVRLAELARAHNDANVIALPARFLESDHAIKIVDTFFNTTFEGGRHEKRVNKINEMK